MKDYKVSIVDFEGVNYLGIKETVKFNKLPEFFERNYAKLMNHMQENKIECSGIPAAVYFGWNMDINETNVAAALPVDNNVTGDGIISIEIPSRKAYMTDYYGPYDEMMPAYTAIISRMEKDKAEMDLPCLELYMNDPVAEPDSSKWHTRIIVFFK